MHTSTRLTTEIWLVLRKYLGGVLPYPDGVAKVSIGKYARTSLQQSTFQARSKLQCEEYPQNTMCCNTVAKFDRARTFWKLLVCAPPASFGSLEYLLWKRIAVIDNQNVRTSIPVTSSCAQKRTDSAVLPRGPSPGVGLPLEAHESSTAFCNRHRCATCTPVILRNKAHALRREVRSLVLSHAGPITKRPLHKFRPNTGAACLVCACLRVVFLLLSVVVCARASVSARRNVRGTFFAGRYW